MLVFVCSEHDGFLTCACECSVCANVVSWSLSCFLNNELIKLKYLSQQSLFNVSQ